MLTTTTVILIAVLHEVSSQVYPIYWEGKVSTLNNGTSTTKIPIYMSATVNQYLSVNNTKQKRIINRLRASLKNSNRITITEQYLPSNEPPVNVSGEIREVTLINGIFTDMLVLENFNYNGEQTIPVRFSSSWYAIDESNSPGHGNSYLTEALEEGNILSIRVDMVYSIITTSNEKTNHGKKLEIDKYLCFYDGYITYMVEDKCYIDYSHWVDFMKIRWNPDSLNQHAVNGKLHTVSNDEYLYNRSRWCVNNTESTLDLLYWISQGKWQYSCHYIQNKYYDDVVYVPADDAFFVGDLIYFQINANPVGLGYVTNLTMGLNRTIGVWDMNFTVDFSDWTIDFPHGMLDSFEDIAFNYEKFKMHITYFTGDPIPKPPRPLPTGFWIVITVLFSVAFIVLLAVLLLSCTCSLKSFNLEIWNYTVVRDVMQTSKKLLNEEKRKDESKRAEDRRYQHYKDEYERIQMDNPSLGDEQHTVFTQQGNDLHQGNHMNSGHTTYDD